MKGFTLLELMIVTAIVAILIAVTAPAYQKYKAEQIENEQTIGIETEETGGLQ